MLQLDKIRMACCSQVQVKLFHDVDKNRVNYILYISYNNRTVLFVDSKVIDCTHEGFYIKDLVIYKGVVLFSGHKYQF